MQDLLDDAVLAEVESWAIPYFGQPSRDLTTGQHAKRKAAVQALTADERRLYLRAAGLVSARRSSRVSGGIAPGRRARLTALDEKIRRRAERVRAEQSKLDALVDERNRVAAGGSFAYPRPKP